jgi:DNA-damage-inducible protein J
MAKSAMIRARVEPELKELAEEVLKEIGLSPTIAITLFYRLIVNHRCFPYHLHIPNAETRRAIRDARAGRGLIKADSIDELIKLLDAPEPRAKKRASRRKLKAKR